MEASFYFWIYAMKIDVLGNLYIEAEK